jgi:hypothetical protein
MFLFIMKGLWFGTLGIVVILLGVFGIGGSLGAYVTAGRERRRREREMLLYGLGQKRNFLHVLGDLWNRWS